MNEFVEDKLVQQTTADYLRDQLGWESVYAYNSETFGPEGTFGRLSDHEVVLTRYLRQAVERLNPGLPESAYDDAVGQVTATVITQTTLATNREKHALIRDGVKVSYQGESGKRVKETLHLIDFNEPDNNHFLCMREFWVRSDIYHRRADIVGFVNGLPLLFLECKNIHRNLRVAYEDNYKDYLDAIPQLFHFNAIVMFGNGTDAKVGTITSDWEHFHEWKRLAEAEPGVVHMETALKGICDKRNFLDLVENFVLFDDSTGTTRKILARNHQFLGVNQAMEAVINRESREGRLGVFWHTQGAGKSYSMVMFTRKIRRKLGGNFTFLILTDRDDLDSQLYKTFAGCGVVDHDRDPCRASSGEDLHRLLTQQKAFVFSLIQKFNKEVVKSEPYTQRDDIIVITDEAHRTQYGTLAEHLRLALPKASYIGFTGTPLFKDDEITRRVFGDYVSVYDFQRAVEDNATVPLYYDARGEKLDVAVGNLNERIAEVLGELNISDVDTEQRLESELKRDYHVLTADKRLDQIARDFVEHYSAEWEGGKAMLVCIDKVTCVRMYNLIESYWCERIAELEGQISSIVDPEERKRLERRTKWMRETRHAVVVSEEQGEVERFRRWGLDIKPHRKLIKEGMSLPQAMRSRPEFRNLQRMELDEAFKNEAHPFRIAIVCAMWLTGFDVPSLSTLYLDKPLKAHTLMQAIARANRVYEGKNNGLIVDYCGILRHLRKALATFAGAGPEETDGQREPAQPDEHLLAELAESIEMVRTFLDAGNAPLDHVLQCSGFERNAAILACKEVANVNDESRKRFEILCREVFKKYKACIHLSERLTYRDDRDAINIVYRSLQQDVERADIAAIIQELHGVVNAAIDVSKAADSKTTPYDISKIDFDRLRREFTQSPGQNTTVQSLSHAVDERLQRMLLQNPLRTDFQDHYESIVRAYNREKDRATIEQTFEALLKLVEDLTEEEGRAIREGLDEESLAVFDLLKKPELDSHGIRKIKKVAVALLETLKAERLKVRKWRERENTRDAVKVAIYDFLYADQTGLPDDLYDDDEVRVLSEEVFRHVYRVYPKVPSPVYASAP